MADRHYVQIRSWHVLSTWTRVPNVFVTLCGRRGSGDSALSFGDDKTCESCLRIAAKRGL